MVKPHFDCSDKKRTPEFVGEIQAVMNNDPSRSIKSITRDIGVSYQADNSGRHLLLLIQGEKGTIFIADLLYFLLYTDIQYYYFPRTRANTMLSSFSTNVLQLNMQYFFSDEKNFQSGSDRELTKRLLAFSVHKRYTNIDGNQITSSHHSVWGGL